MQQVEKSDSNEKDDLDRYGAAKINKNMTVKVK